MSSFFNEKTYKFIIKYRKLSLIYDKIIKYSVKCINWSE